MSATEPGTLMWIGETDGAFADAYQFCLDHAPQVAMRRDCQQALDRRSVGVRGIVIARDQRTKISAPSLVRLQRRYSAAECLHLLGPLAEGMRSGDELPAADRLTWNRWQDRLPSWLRQWGAAPATPKPVIQSVVVMAASFNAAEPLLDLASSSGVSVAWEQSFGSSRVRNFDAVWWDDSVATAESVEGWRNRLDQCRTSHGKASHAWIVGHATFDQTADALTAGVHHVFVKPYSIDRLINSLVDVRQQVGLKVAS